MRRCFLPPLALALFVLTADSAGPAAQKDDPDKPGDEPVAVETLGKLTLVLDAGGHTADIPRLLFTADGKQLLTCGRDYIRVWDVETGQAQKAVHLPGGYWAMLSVLSPDGKTLAVVSRAENKSIPSRIYLLSTADWQIRRTFPMPASELTPKSHYGYSYGPAVAFSPDGRQLAAGHHIIRVWDLTKEGDEPAREFRQKTEVQGLAFSPDGRQLIDTPGLNIRNLASGERKALHRGGALSSPWRNTLLAWSPDGKTIALGSDDGLWLFEPDGKPRAHLLEKQRVPSVSFSPDSRRVLATGTHGARIFPVAGAAKPVDFTRKDSLTTGELSPDGKLAAVARNNAVFLWNASDGALVRRLPSPRWLPADDQVQATWNTAGTAASFNKLVKGALPKNARTFNFAQLEFESPTGARHGAVRELGPLSAKLVADKVQVLNRGKVLTELKVPRPYPPPTSDRITLVGAERVVVSTPLGISPSGTFLFDAQTGQVVTRMPLVSSTAPSPDGHFLLTLARNQLLQIREAREGKLLLSLFVNGQDWVVWTPEGYYAATPGGERLIGWKVDHGMDVLPSYYPAEQFRKQLYRPDVIKLVLEKGSVAEAVKAANAARRARNIAVPTGESRPDKLLPPTVTLAVDDSKKPTVRVRLTAHQGCPEQPIKSLRLLVDGRPLPDRQAYETLPAGQEKASHEATWTIELPPGRHKLAVLARSKDDTPSASNTVEVVSPAAEKDRPVVRLVAVGVSRYARVKPDLEAAHRDAEQIADALAAAAKAGTAYRAAPPRKLLDKDATRDAVLAALDEVRKTGPRPDDLLVVSFAGHGVREGGEFFLLTHESDPTSAEALKKTAVSGTVLREKLADFPCQVLLLLDACHSGAVGGLAGGSDEAARALSDADVRVAVMCAALGHEKAIESNGAGLFTSAVVRALHRDPDTFYDRSTGELNVYHLQAFVYQEVTRASDHRQTPYLKMPLAQPAFVVAQFPR
jgi:WD40 repeat protein